MGAKSTAMAALARNGLMAARRGFHSTVAKGRQDAAGMARLPVEFHALTGGANHAAITGSALEKSPGYQNDTIHEQAELWWDDGRAMVEPVFDSDHIPLAEAVSPTSTDTSFVQTLIFESLCRTKCLRAVWHSSGRS